MKLKKRKICTFSKSQWFRQAFKKSFMGYVHPEWQQPNFYMLNPFLAILKSSKCQLFQNSDLNKKFKFGIFENFDISKTFISAIGMVNQDPNGY